MPTKFVSSVNFTVWVNFRNCRNAFICVGIYIYSKMPTNYFCLLNFFPVHTFHTLLRQLCQIRFRILICEVSSHAARLTLLPPKTVSGLIKSNPTDSNTQQKILTPQPTYFDQRRCQPTLTTHSQNSTRTGTQLNERINWGDGYDFIFKIGLQLEIQQQIFLQKLYVRLLQNLLEFMYLIKSRRFSCLQGRSPKKVCIILSFCLLKFQTFFIIMWYIKHQYLQIML